MSLYVCQECGCVENTALTRFWFRNKEGDGRALCSECDPKMGEWHGFFPKEQYDPARHQPANINGEWQDR